MIPTREKLSKVLLQLNSLVKHFIGLLVRLPLIYFPVKDSSCSYFKRRVKNLECTKTPTYIRASMDFGFIKMAIG